MAVGRLVARAEGLRTPWNTADKTDMFPSCSPIRRTLAFFAVSSALCSGAAQCHGQVLVARNTLEPVPGVSSSRAAVEDAPYNSAASAAAEGKDASSAARGGSGSRFWHSIGFDVHAGINGIGGDIAVPVATHFNLRAGGDYFSYSTTFTEEGADVAAALKLGRGKVALDWYPFQNGFRISPQLVFAIQTHVDATVLVPAGRTISLDGSDYVSSNADPLRGSATVKTRSVAPGLTVGWGNIAPHGTRHWSFPVELGFYYIGQPDLAVTFTGSACDPNYPQPLGCQSVSSDAGFQRDLAAFIRRNQNNLSYASFFPEASVGVGYRF